MWGLGASAAQAVAAAHAQLDQAVLLGTLVGKVDALGNVQRWGQDGTGPVASDVTYRTAADDAVHQFVVDATHEGINGVDATNGTTSLQRWTEPLAIESRNHLWKLTLWDLVYMARGELVIDGSPHDIQGLFAPRCRVQGLGRHRLHRLAGPVSGRQAQHRVDRGVRSLTV